MVKLKYNFQGALNLHHFEDLSFNFVNFIIHIIFFLM